MNESGLQLRSTISEDGVLTIDLANAPVPEPADNEVVIRVEAAPLNPSDMAFLTYPADLSTGRTTGSGADTVYTADVPAEMLAKVKARIGVPVPVGNEGSGTVVRAGRGEAAQALLGKTVAAIGGAMYCQYRLVNVAAVLPLGEGISAKQGASCFVNPMTALAMTECMSLEGFKGIVHTAAASNLGQMLNRICMADGINLVNIVRKEEQAELLRQAGAKYVVNSSSDSFREELSAAIAATEAYLCFDAIGGGSTQDDILSAMEDAATKGQGTIGPYGSDTLRQIYVYGGLNPEPTVLKRNYGFAWSVSGWLTSPFVAKLGLDKKMTMRRRVAAEIDTTFESSYHDEVSLAGALQAENIARFSKQSTGTKYLINPSMEY
jgi:NADPH2:quinone reductase